MVQPTAMKQPNNRRLFRFLFFFMLIIGAGVFFANAQPVSEHGQLSVKGGQLVDAKGKPLVLRGVSFGWHNYWPRFYNEAAVNWLATDWYATVVRAAMGVEPDGGYSKKPTEAKEKIRAIIDGAIKSGVYVIVDWHSHNINTAEAVAFFKEISAAYSRYPNIIYEIFNEPDHETWAEVKKYSAEVIAAIRANDKDNIILVGSPHWDQDLKIVADDPLTGYNNIMYSLHYYAATHKQGLRDQADYAIGKGIPIFISECAGMEATGNGPINDEEWQRWIDWSEANKISWVVWSVSEKDETCSMLKASAGAEGKWDDRDLKESGLKAREYLRYFNRVNNRSGR